MDGYHIVQQINLASTLLLSNSSFGYLHSSAEIWVKKIKKRAFFINDGPYKGPCACSFLSFSPFLQFKVTGKPRRCQSSMHLPPSVPVCQFPVLRFLLDWERNCNSKIFCPRTQHHSADQEKNVWVRSRFRKNIKAVYPKDVFSITLFQLLNILEEFVISKGLVYSRLDGGTKPADRTRLVHEFNVDPNIFLCLISTKAGGLGLNFTGANIVIIFDPNWNPSSDLQAQDRYLDLFRFRVWLAYN